MIRKIRQWLAIAAACFRNQVDFYFQTEMEFDAAPNDAVPNDAGEFSVCNEFGTDETGRIFVPFGDHKNKVGLQKFDRAAAEIMQAAMNDFGKCPIYFGHPDVAGRADSNPAAPAVGWVTGIKIENDGVEFTKEYGPKGQQAVNDKEFRFHSPNWLVRKLPDGKIQPVRLLSIGLTNKPNILVPALANDDTATVPAWLTEALRGANRLDDAVNDEAGVKAALTAALGQAAKADELKAANDVLTTKVATLEGEKTALANDKQAATTALAATRKAWVEPVLTRAVNDGRLLPADRERTATELLALPNDTDIAARLTTLEAAAPVIKTKPVTGNLGGAKAGVFEAVSNDEAQRQSQREQLIQKHLAATNDALDPVQRYNLAFGAASREKPELFGVK